MTQLIWAYISWGFLLVAYVFQRKAYNASRRAYNASRKECEFLYTVIRINTDLIRSLTELKEKQNDDKHN